MIDFAPTLINVFKLENIDLIPESISNSNTKIPCITFIESNNSVREAGDTIEYSDLSFTLSVWASNLKTLNDYAKKADKIMRNLGFKRTSNHEQWNNGLGRKILKYDAIGIEELEE